MDILKPCPFCGGAARLKIVPHVPVGYDYIPQCTDASCAGRLNKKFGTKDVAIYAWNRRKSERQTGEWTIKEYQVPIKNKQVPTIAYTALSEIEPTACKIIYTYTHSFCKSEEYLNKSNYCPNCGAKMFEPQESEE